MSAELRGRKRRAQECVGPAVVNASVAFCETVHDYVDSDGVIIKARIDPQESRAFHDMTVEDVLGPEPPAEDQ